MSSPREKFGSRATVIMAMAGSAIGLGNIWRFPFIVGEYGGAAFILVYIVCCFLLSLPIFLSETIIGRRTHQGTFGAMNTLAPGTAWKWLGLLTVASPLIILSYYSVVGGWSFAFLCKAMALQFQPENADAVTSMFGQFSSSTWGPLTCMAIFLGLTALIVYFGVNKGIERFSKISIPVLFVLIVLIAIYSISLPGAGEGVKYLVKPDFSKLSPGAYAAALGQSFFSLSLGVGTMLTYASYVSKEENILLSSTGTAFFDLLFAILAGFAVMPAVFAAGIAPSSGPGLVFETLPFIFAKMGSGSGIISAIVSVLFFLTILVAALSSSISMMEVGVAYLVEEKKQSRHKATIILFSITLVIGILCSLSFGVLSDVKLLGNTIFNFCDRLASNFLMTIGALLFSIFVGWKMDKSAVKEELTNGGKLKGPRRLFPFVYFLIKYIAPVTIAAIFLIGILG